MTDLRIVAREWVFHIARVNDAAPCIIARGLLKLVERGLIWCDPALLVYIRELTDRRKLN